ncbi:ankyrin repeat-containing protein ITN1-like [Pistacia vera]|uniref:ankyrin repeat-containing protein ITN1-like n=1 Tax=Pistacia vera TaxID=55513 RepID=UPI001263A03C|nr:ankyrin repeat-containing protein ITN1-like [Pistacia vera]
MHIQTLEIVRMMCHEGVIWSNAEASKPLATSILTATRFGICEMEWKAAIENEKTDNILHLTGRLVPSSRVSGAALHMQRELQWLKAVESYVRSSFQDQKNSFNKTPREVFTEEHKDLVKEGEKWMKGTDSSCTLVAALITTVVFATAFPVPGGNNNDGIPNFMNEIPFIVFAIPDALAFISSTASVLMFLGILT